MQDLPYNWPVVQGCIFAIASITALGRRTRIWVFPIAGAVSAVAFRAPELFGGPWIIDHVFKPVLEQIPLAFLTIHFTSPTRPPADAAKGT